MLPFVAELSEPQTELLLILQGVILRHSKDAVPSLRDEDVSAAASAVAATFETADKGIIYNHQASALPAQRLVTELERFMADLRREASAHTARLTRDASVALRVIAKAAEAAAKAFPEEPLHAYLKLTERMASPVGEPQDAAAAARNQPGSRLIIPG
jgi:hypothetical protein